MNKKLLPFIFLIITVLDIIFIQIKPSLRFISKPLILIILMIYFWLETSSSKSSKRTIFLIALFFAWLGDIFLMFEGKLFFMFGLGFFLIMQLLYIKVFMPKNKLFQQVFSRPSNRSIIEILIIILIFGRRIIPVFIGAKELLIPVIVYFLAIFTMVFMAKFRDYKTFFKGQDIVFIGALFFFFSDYFIAHTTFVEANSFLSFLIMPTYVFAQFCICYGVIHELKANETIDNH